MADGSPPIATTDAAVAPAVESGGPTTRSRATRWRGGRRLSTGHEIYWWVEVGIVVVFDLIYESVRNANKAGAQRAYDNAVRIIDWQKTLGIYHEQTMQQWAVHYEWLIIAANYFYGSVYIGATVFTLVFLYRRFPDDYPLWRNTLLVGTLLGLIGFATFPLMPPRLLPTMAGYGGFHYVDTLVKFPTFWSFDSSAMKSISNQYAAMPSLHCGWALWGCSVLLPRVRSWWAKALAVAYPVVTILVVVITANHYFLDAVGGAAIFLVGYGVARLVTRSGRTPRRTRSESLVSA
ncbi:MAG: phosphatase PAP2 family protein [Acidimicrobiales bacterium]